MPNPNAKLEDTDPMPFGQHKGTAMQDVPVTYLHWVCHNTNRQDIIDYCKRSLNALRLENTDLIWKLK